MNNVLKSLLIVTFLLNTTSIYAGMWRRSLDFVLKSHSVDHVMPFHRGLHDLEKEKIEKYRPFQGGYTFDNIGNCISPPAKPDRKKTP